MYPPDSAVAVLLLGFAGLAAWVASFAWRKVLVANAPQDDAPASPLWKAALYSQIAFGLGGGALLWGAMMVLKAR